MDRRINNQINSIKSEIRKRTDALMNELDELANSFDTQLNESKNKLRRFLNFVFGKKLNYLFI